MTANSGDHYHLSDLQALLHFAHRNHSLVVPVHRLEEVGGIGKRQGPEQTEWGEEEESEVEETEWGEEGESEVEETEWGEGEN